MAQDGTEDRALLRAFAQRSCASDQRSIRPALACSLLFLLFVGCDVESGADDGDGDTASSSANAGEGASAASADSGAGDGGSPLDRESLMPVEPVADCIDRAVQWSSGGYWLLRSSAITPCRDFNHEYSSSGSVEVSCTHEVANDAETSVDELDRALAAPDVLEALAANSSFGNPLWAAADAPSFVIQVEGHAISLGYRDCEFGEPDCTNPPAKVAVLRATLDALEAEQLQAPDCAGTQ